MSLVTRAAQYRQQYLPPRTPLRDHCMKREPPRSGNVWINLFHTLEESDPGQESFQFCTSHDNPTYTDNWRWKGLSVKSYFPSSPNITRLSGGVYVSSLLVSSASTQQLWAAWVSVRDFPAGPPLSSAAQQNSLPHVCPLSQCQIQLFCTQVWRVKQASVIPMEAI